MDAIIPITRPFLPPREEYQHYIEDIWNRNWLTNNGPLVIRLEEQLKQYLGCESLFYLSNGTIALQIAIKALDLKDEIITTPFSYVATTSSIVWESCTPIFVDIDPNTLNIDYKQIEAAVTKKTSAILATHVYGNPCAIDEIDKIAKKHNLKVIYDGAHTFGVNYKGKSIFEYGDITTASFHATKLYHTIEGGAIMTPHKELADKVRRLRNFGHLGEEKFKGIGINGKNSEFHAAMGLCNIKYIDAILNNRKEQSLLYDMCLNSISCIRKPFLVDPENYNYSYYPIIFENETILLNIKSKLEAINIFPRRYFYPDLSTLDYIELSFSIPHAKSIAPRILCLPMYWNLADKDIERICRIISKSL